MQTIRTRRALTALTVSLSAAIATAASIGCSSNGSSFGDAGGSGSTNPTDATGGSGVVTTAGQGQTSAGTGSNPTGATGGNGNSTAGSGSEAGSGNPGGGTGPQGGSGPQGGQSTTGGSGGTAGGDTGPACPKPAGQICHEFFANDNGRHVINYVNEFTSTKPGAVEWTTGVSGTDANAPRTIEIVDNAKASKGKALLVSISKGYAEIDMNTGTKLVEVITQLTGVTGACRIADGTTALGIDNPNAQTPAKIVYVNASGAQLRSFNLPTGLNLRAINRDPATGHFWLSRTETVYELNDQGQVLWQASMGGGTKGYAVWWRAGGGAYATTGEPHTVLEIDGTGKILTKIGDDASFAALKLDFFSGFVRRPNGNYIVANWLGHQGTPEQTAPEVIEFQPDGGAGKAVWQWGNQTLARQITNVFVVR